MARSFLWFSLLLATAVWADGSVVPQARNLRTEGAAAQQRGVPLMLMFYADQCPWCARMEREFLDPMQRSGSYEGKVAMRRVEIDAGFALVGFDGRRTTGAELAARYGVSVTPTLVFLDGEGTPVAEKMVGLTTPDYFGGYLDAAIDAAGRKLQEEAGGRVAKAE